MLKEKSLLAELCDVTFIKDFFSDLSLFYDGNAVAKRKQEWKKHLYNYCCLKNGKIQKNGDSPSLSNTELGANRIDYIGQHFSVLDSKYSTLLQFLALFALFIGVIHKSIDSPLLFLILFWISWVVAVFCCLRGVFRITWGNITENVSEGYEKTENAEVERLIVSVIRRTAWFRAAAFFTVISLGLGVLSIATG